MFKVSFLCCPMRRRVDVDGTIDNAAISGMGKRSLVFSSCSTFSSSQKAAR